MDKMAAILFLPFESRTQKVSQKLTIRKPDIRLSDAYCILAMHFQSRFLLCKEDSYKKAAIVVSTHLGLAILLNGMHKCLPDFRIVK
jgi:hypothetical protein